MRLEKNYSAKKLLYKFKIDLWGTFVLQKKQNFRITKKFLFDFEASLRMRVMKNLRSNRIYPVYKKQKFFKEWQNFIKSREEFIAKKQIYSQRLKNAPKDSKFQRKLANIISWAQNFSKNKRFRFQKKFLVKRNLKPKDPRIKFSKHFLLKRRLRIFRGRFKFFKLKKIIINKVNFRYNILKLKFVSNKIKILKNYFNDKFKLTFNKTLKSKIEKSNKIKKDFDFNKIALKKIFFFNLFNYSTYYKGRFSTIPKLEAAWLKSHLIRLKFEVAKRLGKAYYKNSLQWVFRRPFKKLSTMSFFHKVELLRHLNFFCFSTLSQTRRFLKRVEFLKRPSIIYLGLEGCFLNLLFRTNLFLTTKQIYTFVKLGAFSVNRNTIYNPYKILSVFDSFSVNKKFFKIIWPIFLNKIRLRLILVNVPNYLDFNYRLLNFFIWRLPTELESRFVYSFPFFKPFINFTKVYPLKFQDISPREYASRRKF